MNSQSIENCIYGVYERAERVNLAAGYVCVSPPLQTNVPTAVNIKFKRDASAVCISSRGWQLSFRVYEDSGFRQDSASRF